MARIELRSGTIVDDEVILADGERDLVYKAALMSRSRKREIAEKLDEFQTHFDRRRRAKRGFSREQHAEWWDGSIRLMCDAISLAIEGTAAETPRAGDLLFDSYMADRVTDDQIEGLFDDLYGAGDGDAGEGDSPS